MNLAPFIVQQWPGMAGFRISMTDQDHTEVWFAARAEDDEVIFDVYGGDHSDVNNRHLLASIKIQRPELEEHLAAQHPIA